MVKSKFGLGRRHLPIQNLASESYESIIWTFVRTPWTGDQPFARPLPIQDNTTQKNAYTHPYFERDSNPRSQCSSGWRQYVRSLVSDSHMVAVQILISLQQKWQRLKWCYSILNCEIIKKFLKTRCRHKATHTHTHTHTLLCKLSPLTACLIVTLRSVHRESESSM
jgi:hypothetical protein